MRIVCPSCQATYEVPDQRLAGGKVVRCARCATQWAPLPAAPPLPPAAPAPLRAPEPAARERRLSAYRPRNVDSVDDERPPPRDDETMPPRRRGAMLGWVASLLVLVLLGWAALTYRAAVMHAWPPSARAYAAVGLH